MAETGPQTDDTIQSFVVRTWQEPRGNLRGTVRHVQSQAQHGFTRLSQAQEFIEQNLAQTGNAPTPVTRSATTRLLRWSGLPRRRLFMVASAVVIVIAAGVVVISSLDRPSAPLLGSAIGQAPSQATSFEVVLALIIGLALGSLATALWLRRNQ